jgi:hypothetical protein
MIIFYHLRMYYTFKIYDYYYINEDSKMLFYLNNECNNSLE